VRAASLVCGLCGRAGSWCEDIPESWTCALEASWLRRPSSYRTMSNRAATSKQQSTGRLFAGGSEVRMSNATDNDISCAACAAPVFLPHQPEARSGTWRLRQQQPLTQEWLRKCRRRSSSRSSACRQARDEQRWAAFATRLVVVSGGVGVAGLRRRACDSKKFEKFAATAVEHVSCCARLA